MTAERTGTGQLFIDGQPIGRVTAIELPMPPKPSDLVDFVLRKDFEMRFTLESAMVAFVRSMTVQMARRTMTRRGFRRWRARYWRKAHP